MSADEDEPVGFGRPPPGRRFTKGVSGNPRGRPPKPKTLSAVVERALDEKVEIREQGRRRRISKREATAKQLANASASGDLRAIKLASDVIGKANSGAAEQQADSLSAVEIEIFERLVARIRQGWRQIDE